MNLEHQGIITEKREGNVGATANDAKFLTSSWSSAHIPHNVWTWTISSSAKQKERRGEGRFGKKSNNCLSNIEHQLMAKIAKKQTAATWLEDPYRSTKQQLLNKHSAAADGKRQDNKSWVSPGRFGKKSNNSQQLVARSSHLALVSRK